MSSAIKYNSQGNLFCYTLLAFIVALSITNYADSVVMPPRLQTSNPVRNEDLKLLPEDADDEVPYLLSINEGESIEMKVGTSNVITVNLNKAAPKDVHVIVSVQSRLDMITFINQTSINNTTTTNNTVEITYLRNTFGDRTVAFHANGLAGHAEIVCKVQKDASSNLTIDDSSSFISINIGKSSTIEVIISIVGWIYFFAWSLSFYFQVVLNYQRKSVVGLNFDFLALNLMGFICYTIFNYSLMFSREARQNYFNRYEFSRIPVEYNDLFFAAHAVLLTVITVIQCFIYERDEQRVSILAWIFITLGSLGALICVVIYLVSPTTLILLDVLMYFSYVKLVITLVKYTPQAYMNYKRKATTGWSIHNILLDFTGGVFSIAQMFLLAYNYDDWISIFGNFTKFGLGLNSIMFDILFLVQHYVLYNPIGQLDVSTDSIPSPVINQSVITPSFRASSDNESTQDNNRQDES